MVHLLYNIQHEDSHVVVSLHVRLEVVRSCISLITVATSVLFILLVNSLVFSHSSLRSKTFRTK